jgi:thiol-disulfide isomerase/thioredoxin
VRLPDLAGEIVALERLCGSTTVLLFWNPDCGFCRQILNQVKELELGSSKDSIRMLIVSTGSVE